MTPDDLRAWQQAMNFTYDTAAAALGVSRAAYADWIAGRSRTSGRPVKVSRLVGLACAALAGGLEEWSPNSTSAVHHPMRRMHKPDPKLAADKQEKRSVIAVEMVDVDRWLEGSVADAEGLLRLAPVGVFEAGPV